MYSQRGSQSEVTVIAKIERVPAPPAKSVVAEVLLAVNSALTEHAEAGGNTNAKNNVAAQVATIIGPTAEVATDDEYTPTIKIDEILVATGVLCAQLKLGPISNVQILGRLRERLNNLLAGE